MTRRIGPPDPPASFQPQWFERRLEEEMDDGRGEVQCRLCACTESSACEGGCWWRERDLCSSCDQLRHAWPLLMIADGHGMAATHAEREAAWAAWKAELVAVAERYDSPWGERGPIAECGEECWRGSFDNGDTPEDALLEVLSYAD